MRRIEEKWEDAKVTEHKKENDVRPKSIARRKITWRGHITVNSIRKVVKMEVFVRILDDGSFIAFIRQWVFYCIELFIFSSWVNVMCDNYRVVLS